MVALDNRVARFSGHSFKVILQIINSSLPLLKDLLNKTDIKKPKTDAQLKKEWDEDGNIKVLYWKNKKGKNEYMEVSKLNGDITISINTKKNSTLKKRRGGKRRRKRTIKRRRRRRRRTLNKKSRKRRRSLKKNRK